jgi:iron complex outermembrane receptor protein
MGNRDRRKGTLSVSGPILGESFRGRASVLYDEWDGSYTNSIPGGPDIGGYRYRSYQTSLLWQPAEAWEINLSYYKSNDDIDEPSIMGLPPNCEDRVEPPPNTADNPVQAGARLQNFCGQVPDLDEIPGGGPNNTMPKIREAAGQNRELDRASFTIDWNLYEYGSLTALTGYSKTDEDALFDFGRGTGYNQPFRYCAAADDQGPQVPNRCLSPADEIFFTGVLDVEPGDETEEWSQELRWTSPQDQRLRVTGGAYWFKRNLDNKEGNPVAAPFDGNNPLPQPAPGAAAIGLPPFNPPNPDLAIGTAIFYGMFADNPFTPGYDPDGGVEPDPLGRSTKEVDTESWALFTGADFDLTDRLTSRAELRYSQEAEEVTLFGYTRCQQAGYVVDPGDGSAVLNPCLDDVFDLRSPAALPTCVPGENRFGSVAGQDVLLCSPEASSRFDSWTGRGGLKFQATDDWMIYGSIAYGEKPGGANLVIAALAAIPGAEGSTVIVDDFDPEKITAYELGAKGFLFDRRVSLDVAAFWNDWRDIVLRQLQDKDDEGRPLEQPAGVNINAGDATVLGAEASVQVLFTENLTGNFTLSWTDAELDDARQDTYSRFPSFRADGCFPEDAPPGTPEENKAWFENCNAISGDVSGNQLLRQPEWTSSASLSYRRELVDDWEWYVRGDANYLSDVYIGNDNASWLAARTVVNTKFGLSSRKYRIEIWARNLFDERSATGAYRDIWFANSDNLYPPYTNQGPRPNFDDFVPWRITTSFPNGRTYGITGEIRFGAGAL